MTGISQGVVWLEERKYAHSFLLHLGTMKKSYRISNFARYSWSAENALNFPLQHLMKTRIQWLEYLLKNSNILIPWLQLSLDACSRTVQDWYYSLGQTPLDKDLSIDIGHNARELLQIFDWECFNGSTHAQATALTNFIKQTEACKFTSKISWWVTKSD